MLLFLLFLCISHVMAAASIRAVSGSDQHLEVTSLPGWEGPLPSRIFSGFTYAGTPPGDPHGSMWMHYLWIESEGDPLNDPTIVWYNGGPGASSLFGLFVELGPLLLNSESLHPSASGIPRLIRNPHSWSKVANLLIVNSPPPVGFSYCLPAGPAADGTSCGAWNDTLVAQANHHFLTRLFNGALKAHLSRPLFLTGESYAGIYVPTIAREILKDPQGIRLAGFAVGDGCLGVSVLCGCPMGPYYILQFLHGHGQVSQRLYSQIQGACADDELRSGQLNSQCQDLINRMYKEVGAYYSYGLYDECYWDPSDALEVGSRSSYLSQQLQRVRWGPGTSLGRHQKPWTPAGSLGAGQSDYPCPGGAMDRWLSLPDVRRSLHVPVNSYFFSGDNGVGFDYTLTEQDVRPFHLEVATSTNLRVLVYNGDTDPGINSFVTQDKLNSYFDAHSLPVVSEWRPWTLDGRRKLVGYVMEYQGNWSYATIRGAGHMVPENKPAAALALISAFVHGQPLAPFT